MRCSCKLCGTYMVQEERGLSSCCICPDCGNRCNSCVSADEAPRTVEKLKAMRIIVSDDIVQANDSITEDDSEKHMDWIKLL